MKRFTKIALLAAGLVIAAAGCGHYPASIHSARDIARISSSEYMILIEGLPLEDWPKLQKFRDLQHFRVAQPAASLVTDEHLNALSGLSLPKLSQVSFEDCRNVTDRGFVALGRLTSIEGIRLAGTSITDQGLGALVATLPHLKGIDITNCNAVTSEGFFRLRDSSSLTSAGISIEQLSSKDLESVIQKVPNVTWWTIFDPRHTLDHSKLREIGLRRGITIQVSDERNHVTSITTAKPQ